MRVYCYSAEALNPTMVKSYEQLTGLLHGFVRARSQMEAIRAAMAAIIDYVRMCPDWTDEELGIRTNEIMSSITIYEKETEKVINHIQHIAVHEC